MEMTIDELRQATETAFPDTDKRQNATSDLRVDSLQYIPTSGGIIIKGKVVNTNKGSEYFSNVFVEDVEYSEEGDTEAVKINGSDGSSYYIKSFLTSETDVKVSCTCMDFHYRFAMWNFSKDSLYGEKPEPYQRKTTNRPEVNPTHSAGVCKHLIKVFGEIKQKFG